MHRVYVRDRDTWTLAMNYARKGPLPRESSEYVVLETQHPPSVQQVCMVTDDGLRLCDVGVEHNHYGD